MSDAARGIATRYAKTRMDRDDLTIHIDGLIAEQTAVLRELVNKLRQELAYEHSMKPHVAKDSVLCSTCVLAESDAAKTKAEAIADALEIGPDDERDVVVEYLAQALTQYAAEQTAALWMQLKEARRVATRASQTPAIEELRRILGESEGQPTTTKGETT